MSSVKLTKTASKLRFKGVNRIYRFRAVAKGLLRTIFCGIKAVLKQLF